MLNYQMVSEASHYQRVSPTTSPSCAKLGGGIGGSLGINGAGLGASKRAGKFHNETGETLGNSRNIPANGHELHEQSMISGIFLQFFGQNQSNDG